MQWEGRRQSNNVVVDCLGLRTRDLEAGIECHRALDRLRTEYSSYPAVFDTVRKRFDNQTTESSMHGILPVLGLFGETPQDRLEKFQKALNDELGR